MNWSARGATAGLLCAAVLATFDVLGRRYEAYDVPVDPDEQSDLINVHASELGSMQEQLLNWMEY